MLLFILSLLRLRAYLDVILMACAIYNICTWWRDQMETFSALLILCAGNSPVIGESPSQSPVTRSFDVFFDPCLSGWINNGEAGDLRRHHAHYDVIVMYHDSRNTNRCQISIAIAKQYIYNNHYHLSSHLRKETHMFNIIVTMPEPLWLTHINVV